MSEKLEEILINANCVDITSTMGGKLEMRAFFLDSVSSTNLIARLYAEENFEKTDTPTLFSANAQSEGRGRMGRSFYSPEDTGLYMTLLLRAPQDSGFALLTALSALAVTDAVWSELGELLDIKWVNDLYKNGKKIAGILAESFVCAGERLVAVGVGINLSTRHFPEEIQDRAGSLFCCEHVDERLKRRLAEQIAKNLISALRAQDKSEYMRRYRERSLVLGKEIEFLHEGKTEIGIVCDIDSNGALDVQLADGRNIKLSTGEISIFLK